MCGEQRHEQPEASTQKRNIGVPFFRGRTSSLRGRPPLRGSFVDSKGGPLLNGAGSNPRERDVAAVQADREHTTETRDRLPHWQEEATHQPRGTPHHHHMPPKCLQGNGRRLRVQVVRHDGRQGFRLAHGRPNATRGRGSTRAAPTTWRAARLWREEPLSPLSGGGESTNAGRADRSTAGAPGGGRCWRRRRERTLPRMPSPLFR